MRDFTRSTSVQRESYKILFRPHLMIIRSSLHNATVAAFPDAIYLQCCLPSVSRPSSFAWSPDVPFQNLVGPTFRGQGCNIRSKLPYCLDACDRPVFQSSVVRQHLCTLLSHPCRISCQGDAQLVSAKGPTTMRINRRFSTSSLAISFF